MYVKIPILFLIVKTIYCNENPFKDLNAIHYIAKYNDLERSFSERFIGRHYRLSDDAMNKIGKKMFWYDLCSSFFSGIATPYILLEQEYLQEYGTIGRMYHQKPKGICFIYAPHCGDLAFCIRQANSGADKHDLLKLLDASYEVQKLLPLHAEDFAKMCHSVNLRSEIGPLINAFYNNTYTIYTFDSYKNDFQEVLQQATIFYSISVLKNLFLIFLFTNQMSNILLTYSFYGTISFLIFLDIMNLGMHVDVKVGMCDFITVLFLFLLHENMLHNTICYYANILCVYWIAHSSFYFIKLYFKYDTFKKSMNEFERECKISLLLKEQREKLTILL